MTGAPALTRDRVMQLIKKMKVSRIVVIGDIMIDRYLVGDTERVSPEAPVPVVTIRDRHATLGGAANVAANVAALGPPASWSAWWETMAMAPPSVRSSRSDTWMTGTS